MRDMYHSQLDELHAQLKEMGHLCEQAVSCAVSAAATGDAAMAVKAKKADALIDHQERNIEALCMKLLLKQQPVAGELRDISAALKMITDLERIGDQASDIAELSRFIEGMDAAVSADLQAMSADAQRMVSDGIAAFICRDLNLAREVIAFDDQVDSLFIRVKRDLIAAIARDKESGERWLDALMVAKYLERIGDHATNVAEWAEYAITGKRSKNGVMVSE